MAYMKFVDLPSRRKKGVIARTYASAKTAIIYRGMRWKWLRYMKRVEGHYGPLPLAIRRRADEYSREVFGSAVHSHWLYLYSLVQGTFKEGWIPRSYYNLHVQPTLAPPGPSCGHRHLLGRIMGSDCVPDLAYVLNGSVFTKHYEPVPNDQAAEYLFRDQEQVIFKRNGSGRGRGIWKIRRTDFERVNVALLPAGTVQQIVKPHPAFDRLLPETGPTLRVFTVREPGGHISVRATYLRVSRAAVDHVIPLEGININIDLSSGKLLDHGYDYEFRPLVAHPDTGFVFQGFQIPHFHEVIQTLVRFHESFKIAGIIGWDACVDADGKMQLFEWNLLCDATRFPETTSGPSYRGLGWEDLWKQQR